MAAQWRPSGEALTGQLDLLLLAALRDGPAHGHAIIAQLKSRSGGTFDLPEGTIYPALHRLERRGLIASRWSEADGRRRRVYRLAPRGRRVRDPRPAARHVSTPQTINAYLSAFNEELEVGLRSRRRIFWEVTVHLQQATEEQMRGGASAREGEARATAAFGAPEEVAARFQWVAVAPARSPRDVEGLAALGDASGVSGRHGLCRCAQWCPCGRLRPGHSRCPSHLYELVCPPVGEPGRRRPRGPSLLGATTAARRLDWRVEHPWRAAAAAADVASLPLALLALIVAYRAPAIFASRSPVWWRRSARWRSRSCGSSAAGARRMPTEPSTTGAQPPHAECRYVDQPASGMTP